MTAFYRSYSFINTGTGERMLIHRPEAEILVAGPKGNALFRGRLDTGADETLLPWMSIDTLGVKMLLGSGLEITGWVALNG